MAYHDIDIDDDGAGGAWVSHATDDNRDTGEASESASWRDHWPDAAKALAAMGASRIGCSGIRVRVRHNGVEVRS